MRYDGPLPYLESTDQLADIPGWSRDLVDVLALPDPASGASNSSIDLPAGTSSYTLVPGLASAPIYLDTPTVCIARLSTYVTGSADSYHHLQLRITGGDGAIITPGSNSDIGLWRATPWAQIVIQKTVTLQPGATGAAVQANYRTPSGTTAKLYYPKIDLIPLRAAA